MKADCSSDMIWDIRGFILSTNILVITLLTKLDRLIGLNSENEEGLWFLGMRVMKVLPMDFGMGTPH
jgi:hypothetical protein